jgi:ornithine cyclodeaminase/alanine dehydrogenase-like protein (mu-crystallin family)
MEGPEKREVIMGTLPHIPAERVHELLPYRDLVDALEAGHLEPPADVRRTVYSPEGSSNVYLGLPAWQPGVAIGVKLVTVFPDNLGAGLPSVQAVYVLFDGEHGSPLATMDGTALTYRKTACDSALGSRFLSRQDSRTLLMVGAGGMARHLIAAHRCVRPSLDRVLVWNRTRDRAAAVAAAAGGEVADDLDAAVEQADIISTATMTRDPLIKGALLSPGTHLDLVGAYLPDHREADDGCVELATIYVDSRLAAVEESGDLVIPMEAGIIGHDDIAGDLFDLCSGAVGGRSSPNEITLFENGGGGHLDLMTGRFAWSRYDA